ncbi:MAG: hypothetical protein J6T55_03080 [Alphaproteobacteria bacterium]|nr:hypothetical protein [Alphaproteobacteria bacterium]
MSSFKASAFKKTQPNALAQLYSNMCSCPTESKLSLLDRMDKYVQLSRSAKTINTREFEELERKLKFDIYLVIEGDFYEEINGSLALPTEALETYKTLPDKKRALFRQDLMSVPHKRRSPLSLVKQKAIA